MRAISKMLPVAFCRCAIVMICGANFAFAAENASPRIADDLCALRFDKNTIVVSDASGLDILAIGKIPFVWDKACAVPKSATVRDGKLEIAYDVQNSGTNDIQLTATASLTGHGFKLDALATIPLSVRSGGQMIEVVRLNKTTRDQTITKCGYWQRCKPAEWKEYHRDGVPFEVKSCNMKPYRSPTQTFWCLNTGWSGARTECIGFPRKSTDGTFRGSLEFLTGVHSENAELAAAAKDGRKFVMAFRTNKPFNLFEKGSPSVELTINSLIDEKCDLCVTARDFDGKLVLNERKQMKFSKAKPAVLKHKLPSFKCGRGIYFLEASIQKDGAEQCFTRTSVAVLPPYKFKHRDKSVAAMAAYPNDENAYRLLDRLGVSILRYGDNSFFKTNYGITAYGSSQAPKEIFNASNPKHVKYLEERIISQIRDNQNPYFEFGNEVGWKASEEERERLVLCYKSWVVAIRKRLDEIGLQTKLITFGLQPDYTAAMMNRFKEHGVFDMMCGLTLHPGRGFYTADYIQGGWTFRGIIHRARRKFEEMGYGDKEIHITECYAATHPNDGWKDSYRQAAENTLLTLVVATAEPGVKNAMFYKLQQGTSQDPHGYPNLNTKGTSTVNAEYDFGLLMRDDSPKPSLLSYAATCEQLDGARFKRELPEKACGTLRAFEFATPRGTLHVLYDRIEGGNYFKAWKKGCPRGIPESMFRHNEAWERHWKKTVTHRFKTSKKSVTVIDVIGRRRVLAADKDGNVEIALDGEPVMVYGLDLDSVFASVRNDDEKKPEIKGTQRDFDYTAEERSVEDSQKVSNTTKR